MTINQAEMPNFGSTGVELNVSVPPEPTLLYRFSAGTVDERPLITSATGGEARV